ncbi:MAG: hypothetical protein QF815_01925 [Candidatus Peribacteraceae bacterium]|nr:hypothetical protein [Candidatus Peribacteraceae bacterium]
MLSITALRSAELFLALDEARSAVLVALDSVLALARSARLVCRAEGWRAGRGWRGVRGLFHHSLTPDLALLHIVGPRGAGAVAGAGAPGGGGGVPPKDACRLAYRALPPGPYSYHLLPGIGVCVAAAGAGRGGGVAAGAPGAGALVAGADVVAVFGAPLKFRRFSG